MTTHDLLLLVLGLGLLVVIAVLAGVLGFGVARWGGASVPEAISRGGLVFASATMMGIALLGVLLPVVT